MPRIATLEQAFVHELSDVYNAEKQLLRALPKLARATTDSTLSEAFTSHVEETQAQIERIDKIAEAADISLKRVKCQAMEGLISEGQDAIEDIEKGPVRDAILLISAQKAEHYEIASYGSLIAIADALGHSKAADMLRKSLAEERPQMKKLNALACGSINVKALEMASQSVPA